ncbi:MAG TPA: hypothetical protein PKI41_13245 [Candidatus Competibacteraceae bacterium]|nr:hypothetical protein [Candidatus Competibacteraceae bacterium]HQA26784.1 hypothetical protein [Candidatus Competibacteraceae bacterium]HQD57500.1 hypothetical protein [Candidatus Competibacteraceae bacterium]
MWVDRQQYPRRWLGKTGWRRWLAGGLLITAVVADAAPSAWMAVIKPDPVTRQSRCLLVSETQNTSDGYDTTPVTLVFNGSRLLAVTESEIDPSFADLQLVIDKEPPFRSDKLAAKNMTLLFEQDVPDLVEKLRAGRQATLYVRFWPTWPATQSFSVPFSLVGFSKAYDNLNRNCQSPAGAAPSSN